MAMRMHRADEGPQETHEINVTPFIDVMLVLLVIFMATASIQTASLPVELPSTSARATPPDAPLVVSVAADRTLAVADRTVPAAELGAALDRAAGADHGRRIFLRADRDTSYGALVAVMDLLRAAGYLHVALMAMPDEAR